MASHTGQSRSIMEMSVKSHYLLLRCKLFNNRYQNYKPLTSLNITCMTLHGWYVNLFLPSQITILISCISLNSRISDKQLICMYSEIKIYQSICIMCLHTASLPAASNTPLKAPQSTLYCRRYDVTRAIPPALPCVSTATTVLRANNWTFKREKRPMSIAKRFNIMRSPCTSNSQENPLNTKNSRIQCFWFFTYCSKERTKHFTTVGIVFFYNYIFLHDLPECRNLEERYPILQSKRTRRLSHVAAHRTASN